MSYHLELNFDEYFVVNDDGDVAFVGDFEGAVDKLDELNNEGS